MFMKRILKRMGVFMLVISMLIQTMGISAYAEEVTVDEVLETEIRDIDLEDVESILSWIGTNVPDNLRELTSKPPEWWEELLPNQRRVAENLLIPVYQSGEYLFDAAAYVPANGDQVAHMNLSSTGITDGYGNTLWKISNGGENVYCLNHGASCKKSYNYGDFQKMDGEVAYLIEKYGQSSSVSGYISIQMAIWSLMSASTEAEAYSYAYTWYLKSYPENEAAAWAETTLQFFKLANGKNGSVWKASGPAGSQNVAKYQEFKTTTYTEGEEPGGEEPGEELTDPEFALVEEQVKVSYEVKVKKSDWQTGVGLEGCQVAIYENGTKVGTVTTDANGEAKFTTTKTEIFTEEYCSNYEDLTKEQQAEISGYTSRSEAKEKIAEDKEEFENKSYTYTYKEVIAPTGYVWQKNEGTANLSGNEDVSFSFTNERTLGAVEVIKYDTESESPICQGDASIEGAVYGIYAAEDIVHQDKKTGVLYKKDALVQTAVIGTSPKRNADGFVLNTDGSRHIENSSGSIAYEKTPGKTCFGDLELGKYYIKEITAAEGYQKDETIYHVSILYKDQMVKVEKRNETAKEDGNTLHVDDDSDSKSVFSGDYVIKQGVQFVKTSDNTYQTELKPIEGAGFSVYLISDLSKVKAGELQPVNEVWSTEDVMTFYDYDFTEESTAVLYKRSDETWTKGDRSWLEKVEGDFYQVKEMFTDGDGRIETPELPYGTYVIVETTTPEDHVCAKPFIVHITQDGGVLYTDATKQVVEKTYLKEDGIRYGDRKNTKYKEGRMLQKQRMINNTITKTFLRIVKADEEFLVKPGTYIKAEEMVRGTVLKEGAKYLLKCITMDTSKESLLALNWKCDSQGYLSYYDPNGKRLTGTKENPFTTDFLRKGNQIIDCYIILPQEVPIGTYELVELAAPSGYVLGGREQMVVDISDNGLSDYKIIDAPKENVRFTIGNGAVYPDGQMGTNKYALHDSYGNLVVTVLQENQEQKGILEVYKHGEKLVSVTGEKHFLYQDVPISGAKFQIIAEEDIYTQEISKEMIGQYKIDKTKYLLYKKGDVIETLTTDNSGFAYMAGLYLGKYKLVEVEAGDGFVLNKEEYLFEITPQEQTVSFIIENADYKNERQKLEIQVLKKDADSKLVLKGALYGLYAAEDLVTELEYRIEDDCWMIGEEPKVLVKKDTLLAIATTKEDGRAVFMEDLPLGTYYVKELEAPEGYLLSDEIIMIDGTYGSEKGGQLVEKQIHVAVFENKPMEGYEPKPEAPTPHKPKKEETPKLVEVVEAPDVTTHQSVTTGDFSNVFLWGGVFLGALEGAILLWKRKKKS